MNLSDLWFGKNHPIQTKTNQQELINESDVRIIQDKFRRLILLFQSLSYSELFKSWVKHTKLITKRESIVLRVRSLATNPQI